jgi:hypothetical protein
MRLREEALDFQAVLLISIACLVDCRCLLHLELQQLLNAVLHNLSALLHPTSERLQRFFQLGVHLLCNALVGFAHGLDFGSYDIA